MAKPVIYPLTSVLGYPQWQPFTYQLYASNTPTSWSASNLPPGFSFDTATGALSGTPSEAGVFNVAFVATNADGSSDPLIVPIAIAPAPFSNPALLGVNLFVDPETGEVTVGNGIQIKANDDVLLYVQYRKGSVNQDLGTLAELNLTLKEFEPEASVLISGDFVKSGSGSSTVYILYVQAVSDELAAALSNYEADRGTFFNAVAELEWKQPNATGVGPDPIRRSSRLFDVTIVRNLTSV